jgi:hypothetical protein
VTAIILPAILYIIPTVTNNKEINIHDTIIENEIITTVYLKHAVSSACKHVDRVLPAISTSENAISV